MKKATLQISFDSEKLGALNQYMAKKKRPSKRSWMK